MGANRAEAVRALRSVDMPLDEIRAILEADDPDLVHKQLVAHRERLTDRLAAQERTLAYLETLIQRKERIMPYDVEITEVAPQLVAATKVHTTLARIGDDIGGGFRTLMMGLGREGLAPSGAPLIVYPDVIDDETGGDLEICVPVAGPISGDGEVYSRELEGGTMRRGEELCVAWGARIDRADGVDNESGREAIPLGYLAISSGTAIKGPALGQQGRPGGPVRPPMQPMKKELRREVFQIIQTAKHTLTEILNDGD